MARPARARTIGPRSIATLLLLMAAPPALAASVMDRRGDNGAQVLVACPAGGYPRGSIWGTGIYTDDSEVCTAAVHDRRIDPDVGGTVVVEIRPGELSYTGSEGGGVTSGGWPAWVGSFVFVSPARIEPTGPACDAPLYDSMNPAACEAPTDASPFQLAGDAEITRLSVWTDTRLLDGDTLAYTVEDDEGAVWGSGTLRRGDCDPYQPWWCQMEDDAVRDLPAGGYTVRVSTRSTCQNRASGHAGFVVVRGCCTAGAR